jgi:hypothetical protein
VSDIAARLEKVLDRIERIAREASGHRWQAVRGDKLGDSWVLDETSHLLETETPTAEHIVLHDPESVLRRVAADRQILAEHANDGGDCSTCGRPSEETNGRGHAFHETVDWPCRTVLLLAEAYGWEQQP